MSVGQLSAVGHLDQEQWVKLDNREWTVAVVMVGRAARHPWVALPHTIQLNKALKVTRNSLNSNSKRSSKRNI